MLTTSFAVSIWSRDKKSLVIKSQMAKATRGFDPDPQGGNPSAGKADFLSSGPIIAGEEGRKWRWR